MSEKKLNVVTGGTGYVGYALVKQLAAESERVRLFLRKDSPQFDNIDCEKVFGDLQNEEDLIEAFTGADTVYHVAGVVDISDKNDKLLWTVNYKGTKRVVQACKKCGVKTLIYVSSVDAIHVREYGEITEVSEFDPEEMTGTYARTKAWASQYVLDSATDDFRVCVVHPSCVIGPEDYKGSSICEMIRMYNKGLFPVSMNFGAYDFVDCRDVADGMIRAAKYGRNRECYILSGEGKMTVDEFIRALAQINGQKPPKIKITKGFILLNLPLIGVVFDALKLPPVLNEYSVRKLEENCAFSHAKATRELGYNPRPTIESLTDTVNWIKEQQAKEKAEKHHKG